jgi:hypothetical protein
MAIPLDNRDGLREQLRRGFGPVLSKPEQWVQVLHRFACVEKLTLFTDSRAIPFAVPKTGERVPTADPRLAKGRNMVWERLPDAVHAAFEWGISHIRMLCVLKT